MHFFVKRLPCSPGLDLEQKHKTCESMTMFQKNPPT